jgi:lysophospholipase L1-like esterase
MLARVGPAMVITALAIVAAYAVPHLHSLRPVGPDDPVPFWNVIGRPFEAADAEDSSSKARELQDLAADVLSAEPPEERIAVDRTPRRPDPGAEGAFVPHPEDEKPPPRRLELFAGDELDSFFAQLARTDDGEPGAVTTVVHWGDSAIGTDGIPAAVRARMQARFGDAGHGFHLIAPPNTSYRHNGVRLRHNGGWTHCFIIHKCRSDGHYGLGGATFRSDGSAESTFSPDARHGSGRVSAFEIFYQASPGIGRIVASVDRGEKQVIETTAEVAKDAFHRIEVEDGDHELVLRASGNARLYGVTLEREGPGVVWDSLELVGAFTRRMLEYDQEHLRGQLARREAQLFVLTFGGNDMIRKIPMSEYRDEMREVIRSIKSAAPGIECIVMAPLDHGMRDGSRVVSLPVVEPMVNAQREAAKAEGCAFFDTWSAMGGEGSAARWFRHSPRLMGGDLSHATHNGHAVVGEMLYRAIVAAYVDHRRRVDAREGRRG